MKIVRVPLLPISAFQRVSISAFLALAFALSASAQDQTVTGNLTVTGNATVSQLITTGGAVTGDSNGLTINAAAGNQSISLTPTGTGWLTINGNAIVQGTIAPIGGITSGRHDLLLSAGGSNQNVIITPTGTGVTVLNGNVGVGTSSPTTKLDIAGIERNQGLQISTLTGSPFLGTDASGNVVAVSGPTLSQIVAGLGYTPANRAGETFTGGLTLAAGSATAAPLAFQSGPLLAAPVFGAVEFDGTNLYLTNNSSSPTRKTLAFAATTLAGYGITDPVVLSSGSYADPAWITSLVASKLTGTVPVAAMPAYSGDVTSSAGSTTLTLVDSGVAAGTYSKVTVDTKGRVTAGAAIASSDVTGALGFTPVNKSGDTFDGAISATTVTASNGTITGGASGLALNAGGTNQNVTIAPSGTGSTLIAGNVAIGTSASAGLLTIGQLGTADNGAFQVFASPTTYVTTSGATWPTQALIKAVTNISSASKPFNTSALVLSHQISDVSGPRNGLAIDIYDPLTNTSPVGQVRGTYVNVTHSGSGTANFLIGDSSTVTNTSTGLVNNMYGSRSFLINSNNSTAASATNAAVFDGWISNSGGNSNIANASGLKIEDLNNIGTITNTYGVYIGNLTSGTQTNKPYSIYSDDANATAYFGGRLALGGNSRGANATFLDVSPYQWSFNDDPLAAQEEGRLLTTTVNSLENTSSGGWRELLSLASINYGGGGVTSSSPVTYGDAALLTIGKINGQPFPTGTIGNVTIYNSWGIFNRYGLRSDGTTWLGNAGASHSAWGTEGIQLQVRRAPFTDSSTGGSGTVPTAAFSSFAVPILAAANSGVTTTDAATVFIAGGPEAGANQTITNSWGLWNVGNTRLDGNVTVSSVAPSISATTGALTVAGGVGIAGNLTVGGKLAATNFASNGVTGGNAGLALSAGGTDQNITLTPSGAGSTIINGNATVQNSLTVTGNISGGTAGLALTAGGTNQNVTITPSGTGDTILNGNVGIGTNTPTSLLTVGQTGVADQGTFQYFSAPTAIGTDHGGIWRPQALIRGFTNSSSATGLGTRAALIVNQQTATYGLATNALVAAIDDPLSYPGDIGILRGGIAAASHYSAGSASLILGQSGNGNNYSTSDKTIGVEGLVWNGTATGGPINPAITTAISLHGVFNNSTATGTVGTYKGLFIDDISNQGTLTNTYAVYVGNLTAGTQTNKPFSFYASDANALNYFAGNVGIGTSTPTQALDVVGNASISGNLNVGGTFIAANFGGGAVTGGTSGLALNAGGTNQNITLTPSGTGATVLNGNVGVGTTSPSAKLDVAGVVRNQGVQITTLANATILGTDASGNLVAASAASLAPTSSQVTTALGYTPANKAGDTLTGNLKLAAGTATAAPLTLQSGTSLTTPVFGSVEFDGTSVFVTNNATTPTRKALAYSATTLSGYGITDPVVLTSGSYLDPAWIASLTAAKLTGTLAPTVLPAFTGDVTSSAGSTTLTLANSGVTAGTYAKVTVDAKGRVTAGASLASGDITGALGYTPYNSTNPSGYITAAGVPVQSVFGRTGNVTLTAADLTSALTFTPANKAGDTLTGNLKLAAGTATVAPLTLQSGTSLSTPVAGSVEFDGTSIFVTNNAATPTRKALAYSATTLAGYGITDPVVLTSGSYADPAWIVSLTAAKLTGSLAPALLPAFTGDVTSSAGSTMLTLANTGVTAGTYAKVTVDAKGRVSAGAALASGDVTGALGYTPYNSTNPSGYITAAGAPVQSVFGRTGAVTMSSSDVTGALAYTPANKAGDTFTGAIAATGVTATGGTISGGSAGLALNAGGTNQNVMVSPSGTGATVLNGNVGVGTTNPAEKLEVFGGRLKITNGSNSYGWIYAEDTSHSIVLRGDRDNNVVNATNYYQYGGPLSAGNKGHRFWTGGLLANQAERMRIADDGIYMSGNVGIGATAPSAKLEVGGSGAVAFLNGTDNVSTLSFGRSDYSWRIADETDLRIYGGTGRTAAANENLAFTIKNGTGNVGIGTGTPNSRLEVNGDISLTSNFNSIHFLAAAGPGDMYLDVEPGTRTLRTRNWNTDSPNVAATSIHTGNVLAEGNVGIGTTAPTAKLDVAGDVKVSGSLSAATLNIGGTAFSPSSFVTKTGNDSITASTFVASGGSISGGSAGLTFTPGATNKSIVLTHDNPDGTAGAGRVEVRDTLAITNVAGIQYLLMGNQDSLGANHPAILRSGNGTFEFGSGDSWNGQGGNFTAKLTLLDNGNVGIATATPLGKLGIDAGAGATSSLPGIALGGMYEGSLYTNGGIRANGFQQVSGPYSGGVSLQRYWYDGNVYGFQDVLNVTGAGNVGIGTGNPSAKLHIQGAYPQLAIDNPTAGAGDQIRLLDGGVLRQTIGHLDTTHSLQFGTGGTDAAGSGLATRLTIDELGKVGIGTTTPSKTLVVNSSADAQGLLVTTSSGRGLITLQSASAAANPEFDFNRSAGGGNAFLMSDETNNRFLLSTNVAGGSLEFWTGSQQPRLKIDGNGNVGIGTTAPARQLDVYGTGAWNSTGGIRLQGNNAGIEIADLSSGQRWLMANGVGTGNDGKFGLAYDINHGRHNIVVDTAGHVGVGTTSPTSAFEVNGDAKLDTNLTVGQSATIAGLLTAQSGATINGTTNLQTASIAGASNFGGTMTFTSTTGTPPTTSTAGSLGWGTTASDPLSLVAGTNRSLFLASGGSTSASAGLTIASSGNVGIGTDTPRTKLHIQQGVSGAQSYESTGGFTLENSTRAIIQLLTPNTQDAYLMFGNPDAPNRAFIGYLGSAMTPGDQMVFKTSGSFSLTGGNVGIGTTTPAAKLDVVGNGQFSASLAVNTTGDINGGLTVGSSATPNGGNLRLLSSTSRWGLENDNGTLRIFREDASGANQQVTASMASDASLSIQGRVTTQGLTVASGDVNLSNLAVHNVASPTNGTDATNKSYVDLSIYNAVPFTWTPASHAIALKNPADNVGLGTIAPEYKLDVFSSTGARLDNLLPEQGLLLRRDASGGNQSWRLSMSAGSSAAGFKITDATQNQDRLTISSLGRFAIGSIGSGTNSTPPQSALDITSQNNADGGGAQMIIRAPQTGDDQYILFRNYWSTNDRSAGFAAIGFNDMGSGNGRLWFATAAASGGNTANTPTKRMFIDDTGNVGIGTDKTSGDYKLSVEGKVRAREVVVNSDTWADYVFDENYRNAPLSEVEQEIKAHKHLPGVPSAREVAEKGVNVGEMQATLLRKIEELTLHQIEQEKRMQEQDTRIKKLEAENAALRQVVTN